MKHYRLLILFAIIFLFLIPGVDALEKIKINKAYNTTYGIIINWNKDYSADGYNIYRKEKKGKYKLIKRITSNEAYKYLDCDAKNENSIKYKYAVRSYSKKYLSSYKVKSIIRLKTPILKKIKITKDNKIVLKVRKNNNVTGYNIQIAKDKNFKKIVKKITVKSDLISSNKIKVKKGIVLYYRIRSYKKTNSGKTYSEWSNIKRKVILNSNQIILLNYTRNLIQSKKYSRTELFNELVAIAHKKNIRINKKSINMIIDNCGKLKDEEALLFAGDSLTARYNLNYFYNFSNKYYNKYIFNTGVNGYTTKDIIKNFKKLIKVYNSDRLFLLIGTNDFKITSDGNVIFNNIKKLIDLIKKDQPQTLIYLQSLYPINSKIRGSKEIRSNETIVYINSLLKKYCENNNIIYIDTYSKLVDEDGNLNVKYTVDGLHLSKKGYEVVTNTLLPYVNKR